MFAHCMEPPIVRPASDNHLAVVVSVDGVGASGKIQIRLLTYDGVDDQDGPIDARVCVPFAGNQQGAFFIPNVGDEVVVSFVNGDPRLAVVVGGLWNGRDVPPEQLGGGGQSVDRWTIVGKLGTRVALVEEQSGQAKIELETQGGGRGVLTQESGGAVEFEAAGSKIRIDSQGITIESGGQVSIRAPAGMQVEAPFVDTTAGMASFSGVVQSSTCVTNAVVSSSYTPGAGNVW